MEIKKILNGDTQAASRLISDIVDDLPETAQALKELYPHTGRAYTLGVTGAPGVGKSTLVGSLITSFRQRNMTVGVIAIDPTSPFTGGAILGDRTRMGRHTLDRDVFIRSLANRGRVGGLAHATTRVINVMDAMGKDLVLIEAVGSGQGEVDISSVADTTIVTLVPGMGDDVQVMKAGILEIADIFVVNKADLPGAEVFAGKIEQMLAIRLKAHSEWKPPVLLAQAANQAGTDEVAGASLRHLEYLKNSGALALQRKRRALLELKEALDYAIRLRAGQVLDALDLEVIAADIAEKKLDPYSVAADLISKTSGPP